MSLALDLRFLMFEGWATVTLLTYGSYYAYQDGIYTKSDLR